MKAWTALLLVGFGFPALAEGGSCPSGYYPIGGQGVAGCAPIPGYAAGRGASQETRPVVQGRWVKTWGAIADDQTGTGNIGVSVGKRTKREAAAEAISNCESLAGGACKLTLAYENQCAAIAAPSVDNIEVGGVPMSQGAPSIDIAKNLAIPKCKEKNRKSECITVYAACTEQILEF